MTEKIDISQSVGIYHRRSKGTQSLCKSRIAVLSVVVAMLVVESCAVSMTLIDKTTCLEYEVVNSKSRVLFSYHFNPHIDSVNMVLYDRNANILNETGSTISHLTFLEVQFNETGLYPLCFEKASKKVAEIQFDVSSEEERFETAGKEDINKLSRKISQFLIEIKKTGWEFKQVLEQQNGMREKLRQSSNSNYFTFLAKMVVMAAVLGIQFYAVKFFFD